MYLNNYSNTYIIISMKRKEVKHMDYCCIGPTITSKKIGVLQRKIKTTNELGETIKYFAILSGKTRIEILFLLQNEKELCVCDIAYILKTTVSAVSHQLKILRESGFVEFRKDAQTFFYYLSKESKKELKNHF